MRRALAAETFGQRLLRDIEKLPPGDRKAVLKLVDALLVPQRVAGGSR